MSDWKRFQAYMDTTGTSWRKMAELLEYSTSALSNVKKGAPASAKLLRRLASLENATRVPNVEQDNSKKQTAEAHLVKEPPGSYHSPPACDTRRLDKVEQRLGALEGAMSDMDQRLASIEKLLLRLLAEQETGDNKDSNGLAG